MRRARWLATSRFANLFETSVDFVPQSRYNYGVYTDYYRQKQVVQEQKSSSEMGLPILVGT